MVSSCVCFFQFLTGGSLKKENLAEQTRKTVDSAEQTSSRRDGPKALTRVVNKVARKKRSIVQSMTDKRRNRMYAVREETRTSRSATCRVLCMMVDGVRKE